MTSWIMVSYRAQTAGNFKGIGSTRNLDSMKHDRSDAELAVSKFHAGILAILQSHSMLASDSGLSPWFRSRSSR